MSNWILVCGRATGDSVNNGFTKYAQPCGVLSFDSGEIYVQFIAHDSYTLKNLFVRVITNSLDGSTTVRSRKNAVNGNQSVSINAEATGTFQDTTNTDELVDGDLFNYQLVAGGTTGAVEISILSLCLQSSNNTPILGGYSHQGIGPNLTYYFPIGGGQLANLEESKAQYTFRVSATLSNLRGYFWINSITDSSTFRIRVNGENGNQVLSIPASTTGAFEDTINTDSIVSGDNVNCQKVTGSSGTLLEATIYQIKSTSEGRQVILSRPSLTTFTRNVTRYSTIEGMCPPDHTVESDAQVITEIAFVAKNMFVSIGSSNVNDVTTISLRQNGANSDLLVSIPASTTGTFEDLDTVLVSVNDLLNYMALATGTSGFMQINFIGFEQAQPAAAVMPWSIASRVAMMGA